MGGSRGGGIRPLFFVAGVLRHGYPHSPTPVALRPKPSREARPNLRLSLYFPEPLNPLTPNNIGGVRGRKTRRKISLTEAQGTQRPQSKIQHPKSFSTAPSGRTRFASYFRWLSPPANLHAPSGGSFLRQSKIKNQESKIRTPILSSIFSRRRVCVPQPLTLKLLD